MLDQDRYISDSGPKLLRMIRQTIDLICDIDHQNLFPLLDSTLTSPRMLSFLRSAALEKDVFAEHLQLQKTSARRKGSTCVYLEKVLQRLGYPEDNIGKYFKKENCVESLWEADGDQISSRLVYQNRLPISRLLPTSSPFHSVA